MNGKDRRKMLGKIKSLFGMMTVFCIAISLATVEAKKKKHTAAPAAESASQLSKELEAGFESGSPAKKK